MPDLTIYDNFGLDGLFKSNMTEEHTQLVNSRDNEDDEPIWGFRYLGFVGNISFNFVFQEIAYFNTIFGDSFGTLTNMMYCLANNISLVLMIWFGEKLSHRFRIVFGASCLGLILITIPLVAIYEFKFQIWYGLALIGFMGFANSIFTSATYSLSGMSSANARNGQNIGASIPSIIAWPLMVCLNKIFTLAIPQLGDRIAGATTFALLILAALLVFGIIPYYIWSMESTKSVQTILDSNKSNAVKDVTSEEKVRGLGAIIVATLPLALAVWGVSFLTFITIPDQVLAWESKHANMYPGGILGVQDVNIYIFQCSDTLGRFVVNSYPNLLNGPGIIAASASRLILLPLFFLATAQWYFLSYDLIRIGINAVWGISYGILVSLAFIHGPAQVPAHEGDTSGPTMSFAFENGVFMGSCIALCIQYFSRVLVEQRILNTEIQIGPSFQLVIRSFEC